jgi:hypothetical protein
MSSIYEAVPLNRDASSTNIRVIEMLRRNDRGQICCELRKIALRWTDRERRSHERRLRERESHAERRPEQSGPEQMRLEQKRLEQKGFHWGSNERLIQELQAYQALSYAWGPPDSGNSILVGGKPFEVRKNLWDFLNEACTRQINLREEQPGFLWIDAICIDQSQVGERNHQVAMMGRIYSEARKVLVWLGPSTPAIDGLFQNMYGLTVDERYELVWETEVDDQERRMMLYGMEELCSKDYWERLWVVQEYLLAWEVEVWCGRGSVDPEKIKWLVYMEFKNANLAESCALELLQGRKVRNVHAEKLSLKRHLDDFGLRMKCADVRDRVYGLLALINEDERERLGIEPNYALSPEMLFEDLFDSLQFSARYGIEELVDYVDTLRLALDLSLDNKVVALVNQSLGGRRT